MKVGVVGTGVMGRNHARVFSELKQVESLAIFDINRQAAGAVAGPIGAEVAGSLGRLLSDCDAVSICVPTPFHQETGLKAIEHGVHFLMEKPVCQTSAEARAMIGNVPDDLIAGVGHIERFNPIVDEIQKIVRDPLYVEVNRHNPTSSRIASGTVVEDLMIHDIDIVTNSLFDREPDIYARGTGDIATALFSYGTVPVYMSASRKSSKKVRRIYIEEEDCTIEGDFMTQEIYVYRKPGKYAIEADRYSQENIIEKVLVNKLEPLRQELFAFVEAVRTKATFPITLEQGLKNLEYCEKITAQLGQGSI